MRDFMAHRQVGRRQAYAPKHPPMESATTVFHMFESKASPRLDSVSSHAAVPSGQLFRLHLEHTPGHRGEGLQIRKIVEKVSDFYGCTYYML